MTDKEIIKALEYCEQVDDICICKICPYFDMNDCYKTLVKDTLDLINRQQQDISTLKTKCYCISNNRDRIKKRLEIVSRDLQEGSSRLTEAEREKFWKTSDDEIREFWLQLYNYTVPENVKQVIPANMLLKLGHITKSTIDFINRQQEQLEAAIAGQETLQKALAEKDREVTELNSDLKLLKNNHEHLKTNFDETVEKNKRLRDKVVGLTAEKDQLIKTFGECQAEAAKEILKNEKEIERLNNNISAMAVTMHNCAKATRAEAIRAFAERLKQRGSANSDINYYILKKLVDNLVKEMVGDAE